MNKHSAEPRTRIRVLIVDDHAIWRDGLKSLLKDTEFDIVGEAATASDALAVTARVSPGLAIMDVRLGTENCVRLLPTFKRKFPDVDVVMLTTYDNPLYKADAVAAGAVGYLLKGICQQELLDSLRKVARGECLLDEAELARCARKISMEGEQSGDLPTPLTEREVEVLRLLTAGLSNRDIGAMLYVAEGTIKIHVERIIKKLGVSDRVQAAVWAVRYDITPT